MCNSFSDEINWFIDSEFLLSKELPFIFKSIEGQCQQVPDRNCYYNQAEIEEVLRTIEKLLMMKTKKKEVHVETSENLVMHITKEKIYQSDIGVVAPYQVQCIKIAQELRRLNLRDVTVGEAEVFQGREKPIMIISTVRTDNNLGNVLASPNVIYSNDFKNFEFSLMNLFGFSYYSGSISLLAVQSV